MEREDSKNGKGGQKKKTKTSRQTAAAAVMDGSGNNLSECASPRVGDVWSCDSHL